MSAILGLNDSCAAQRLSSVDPRCYGHDMELTARHACIRYQAQRGQPVTVSDHGLFVHGDISIFAASCDGMVHSATGETGVLEIECLVGEENIESMISTKANFCLSCSEGNISLKHTHGYYTQVQMEIAVLECQSADFVVYSHCDRDCQESIFVQRINFDYEFWERAITTLKEFFRDFVVLELVTRRLQRSVCLCP